MKLRDVSGGVATSAALVLLAAGGCSSYQSPRIEVLGASAMERTDEAQSLRLDLLLENPNNEALELRLFDYTVYVDDKRAYSGKRAAQATLNAGGSKQMSIPAVVVFAEHGWSGADAEGHGGSGVPAQVQWRVQGTLLYITPGAIAEILLDTGVRKPTAGFSGSGNVVLAGS
jgi:hypothetical protein